MHLKLPSIKSHGPATTAFSTTFLSLSGSLQPDFTSYEHACGGRVWPSSEPLMGLSSPSHPDGGCALGPQMTRVFQKLTLTPLDRGYRFPFVLLAGLVQTRIASQHTRQQTRPDGAAWCVTFRRESSLFFIETSNCCWLLNMLLLLVNYKSQIDLFNDFPLHCWWTTIQEVAVLFVIRQLSNRALCLFTTGIQSAKATD